MFYEELKQIIRLVLQQGLSGQALMDALTADVNPTEIYASDDIAEANHKIGFTTRLKWSVIDGSINSQC